jgi:hypothetical protein
MEKRFNLLLLAGLTIAVGPSACAPVAPEVFTGGVRVLDQLFCSVRTPQGQATVQPISAETKEPVSTKNHTSAWLQDVCQLAAVAGFGEGQAAPSPPAPSSTPVAPPAPGTPSGPLITAAPTAPPPPGTSVPKVSVALPPLGVTK